MAWREDLHDLLGRLRGHPDVPEPLFRLLEVVVTRLTGPWDPHDMPTRPDIKKSDPSLPAAPKLCPLCGRPRRFRSAAGRPPCTAEFHSLTDSQALSLEARDAFASAALKAQGREGDPAEKDPKSK
jgi:hypothetical protein